MHCRRRDFGISDLTVTMGGNDACYWNLGKGNCYANLGIWTTASGMPIRFFDPPLPDTWESAAHSGLASPDSRCGVAVRVSGTTMDLIDPGDQFWTVGDRRTCYF